MIDIHCHVFPKLSDGPKDAEVSRQIIRDAAAAGVTVMVGVCHCEPGIGEKIDAALLEMAPFAAEHGIHLTGSIEYNYGDIEDQHTFRTLTGDDSWILVDFKSNQLPISALSCFDELAARGIKVVAVHPETLFSPKEMPALTRLWQSGTVFQLNAASFLPDAPVNVRRMADRMLRRGLAGVIASDAHNGGRRRHRMGEARARIEGRYGRETAQMLFDFNPRRLLENTAPVPLLPLPTVGEMVLNKFKNLFRR
jgi:protein-tyrosine phosphatase